MIGPWGRPRGVRVAPRTLTDIRQLALLTREELGIRDHPIDMVYLLENRLRNVAIHFHIVEPDEIPGEAARAEPHRGLLLITAPAYSALHDGDPECQLLIPHELGHFVLRHAVTFARSTSHQPHGSLEDSEIQADEFSHEFLMPVALVKRHCSSAEDIQRAFRVPAKDARVRYSLLKLEGIF